MSRIASMAACVTSRVLTPGRIAGRFAVSSNNANLDRGGLRTASTPAIKPYQHVTGL